MNLPKSGRVVIIDDKPHEALPLIKVLSQQRISTTYFSGRIEDLPEKPFNDVRIIFLDIVLEGLSERDEKSILSTLFSVIRKIISDDNGPFILILWTQNEKYIKNLENMLKKEKYQPSLILNLQKSECLTEDKEIYDLKKIKNKLEEKIKDLGIFDLLFLWENIAYDSASTTVNEISRIIEFTDEWNNKMVSIYYNLAKAWVGQHINSMNSTEILKNSLFTFKKIFEDTLEKNIETAENIPQIGFECEIDVIEKDIIAKINSKLLIDSECNENFYPGYVYVEENNTSVIEYLKNDILDWPKVDSRLKKISKQLKKDCNTSRDKSSPEKFQQELEQMYFTILSREVNSILLEVTPLCDYVQQKMKLNRVIRGFLCPCKVSLSCSDECTEQIETFVKRRTQYLYISPIFEYNNRGFFLVLDFRFFMSFEEEDMKNKKPLFRIRKDVLSEIQIKLSHHISRTGILFLDHRLN